MKPLHLPLCSTASPTLPSSSPGVPALYASCCAAIDRLPQELEKSRSYLEIDIHDSRATPLLFYDPKQRLSSCPQSRVLVCDHQRQEL